jgi:hypothetical protein
LVNRGKRVQRGFFALRKMIGLPEIDAAKPVAKPLKLSEAHFG